jgi:hypothetical protein
MRRRDGGIGCGACACASQAQVRDALGHRPSPLRGTARKGWTRQDERGESRALGRAKSPLSESRKYGPGVQNRRDGALSGARPAVSGRPGAALAPSGEARTAAAGRR